MATRDHTGESATASNSSVVKLANVPLQLVLSVPQCRALVAYAKAFPPTAWSEGRGATGYYKLDVHREPLLDILVNRYLFLIAENVSRGNKLHAWGVLSAVQAHRKYDAWIVHYPTGSHIPPHTDPTPEEGLRHVRVNILLQEPGWGGLFYVARRSDPPMEYCPMSTGEGWLFHSGELEHHVGRVYKGDRYVLSIGALV